jgi:hypothetical protein
VSLSKDEQSLLAMTGSGHESKVLSRSALAL